MSPDGSTVLFGALPANLKLSSSDKRLLTRFARKLSSQIAHGKYFECLITDDAELQRLNLSFRKHDYPTDVLSFPAAEHPLTIGECAISVERASDQSLEFGHSLIEEIELLMLHGILHLIGLDHESDTGQMAEVENSWRRALKLPASLIERSTTIESAAI